MTNWLQAYLEEAARSSMCMKIGCTTCGAADFRKGLLKRLPGKMQGWPIRLRRPALDRPQSLAIVEALAGLERTAPPDRPEEKGVRFLLYEIWRAGHLSPEAEARLRGTWAGGVLAAMQDHARQREAAREAYERRNDPVLTRARREAVRRERQVRHAERLENKKERDRLRRTKPARGTEKEE